MYLPTGTPHMARTQDTASLHVTVGINRYLWRDLVKKVVDPVVDKLDAPLPGQLFTDPAALAAALREKIDFVARELAGFDADRAVASFERSFAIGRQGILGGSLVDRLAQIGPTTRLRRRPGSSVRIRPEGDKVNLLLGDRIVTLPGRITDVVERVAAIEGEFSPSEVHELDEASALVLTKRLVREGLLEVVR